MNKLNFKDLCKKLAFIMLCAVMVYVTFGGASNFLSAGPISLWRVLVLFLILFSLPLLFTNLKATFRNWILWILAGFGVWLAVSAVVGFRNGHDTGLIVRDVKCFIYFALFPFIWNTFQNRMQSEILARCMMYASFALSIFSCVFFGVFLKGPEAYTPLLTLCLNTSFLNFTRVSDTVARILFISTPFQVFGCALPIYFQLKRERFSWQYPVITGFSLFAILITYTRALYLSAAIAAGLLVILVLITQKAPQQKRFWLHILMAIAVFAVLILGFSAAAKTNYMGYAFDRVMATGEQSATEPTVEPTAEPTTEPPLEFTEPTVGESTPATEGLDEEEQYLEAAKQSDAYRFYLEQQLLAEIQKSPVIGSGLGVTVDGRQSLLEFFYLDLWAKTGLVGLVLYLLPLLLAAALVIKQLIQKRLNLMLVVWTVSMAGLMVYSIFQPYMNNATCVTTYCCYLALVGIEYRQERESGSNHPQEA